LESVLKGGGSSRKKEKKVWFEKKGVGGVLKKNKDKGAGHQTDTK